MTAAAICGARQPERLDQLFVGPGMDELRPPVAVERVDRQHAGVDARVGRRDRGGTAP